MSFLFIIIFLAFFVILLLPAILLSIVRTVLSWFGLAPKRKGTYYSHTTWSSTGQKDAGSDRHGQNSPKERKKLFDKDEGEYVDYEEIK